MTDVVRWERRTEWPLAAVAVVFLGAYTWLVLQPTMPRPLHHALNVVSYAAWATFWVDYLVRVALARPRGRYVLRHVPDLLVLALPVLRPLRLLRLIVLLKVLNRTFADSLRGRVVVYVVCTASLVVFAAALAALSAERGHPGANIVTFGDALWWAIVTITTVGYGDRYPVTTEGRFVAVGLMIAGIAMLGVVTAAFASWLVDRVRDTESEAQAATRADIDALRGEIAALTAQLRTGTAAAETERP